LDTNLSPPTGKMHLLYYRIPNAWAMIMTMCDNYNIKICTSNLYSTKQYWNFGYLRKMHGNFANISNL